MRIRTIKPEFWTHPVITRQSDAAQLLALGLLNYADDEGYFYADEMLIRGAIAPRKDSSIIRRSIDELSNIGYIEVREHPTHGAIGHIIHFSEHQRIDRAKSSIIKDLFDSTNDRRTIDDESTLEQGTGNREQGKESTPLPPKGDEASGFERFWKSYPSRPGGKGGKAAARKIWKRDKLEPKTDAIIRTVQTLSKSDQWRKNSGQYIPMVQTFLNQGRFEDESITEPAPSMKREEPPPGWQHALQNLANSYGEPAKSNAAGWITNGWHSVPDYLKPEIIAKLRA